MINLLVDLKEAFGLTLVIIAHDLAVVHHMSDRIAVMYLGQIVELADKEQLFTEPLIPIRKPCWQPSPPLSQACGRHVRSWTVIHPIL